jgi:peptidoglycan-associated lipoprotein
VKKNAVVIFFPVLILLAFALGCAKPTKELSDAEVALRAAKEAGAEELAPEEYKSAEELIERAKDLINQGKYKEAGELLREARMKAEEARSKAIVAKQRGATEEELEKLKQRGVPEVPGLGLEDTFFDFDRYNIRADAKPVLEKNAAILEDKQGIHIVIEGYCDIRGTEEYNLALGQRRADATKNYLVHLGISPGRIEAVSRGETTQWAEGTTEDAYQQNRRAHFIPTSLPPISSR